MTRTSSRKFSCIRNKNIFTHSYRIGFGHSNVDGIAYFKSFPHFAHPYDVKLTGDDKESFPFLIIKDSDNLQIIIGEHNDTYESLLADNEVCNDLTKIKGRLWQDSHYIVFDQATMTIESILKLEAMLKQSMHIDISKYHVLNNNLEAVIPEEQYCMEVSRLVKHLERLAKFLDRMQKDQNTFTSNTLKDFDQERICYDIKYGLLDYELFNLQGKVYKEQARYQKITEKLRDYYRLIENCLKMNEEQTNANAEITVC